MELFPCEFVASYFIFSTFHLLLLLLLLWLLLLPFRDSFYARGQAEDKGN